MRGQGKGRDAWQGVHGRIQTACEVGAGILLPSPPGVQLIQKPEGFIEIREQLDLAESFGASPRSVADAHCSGANRCAFAELSRIACCVAAHDALASGTVAANAAEPSISAPSVARPPDGHDRRKAVHAHANRAQAYSPLHVARQRASLFDRVRRLIKPPCLGSARGSADDAPRSAEAAAYRHRFQDRAGRLRPPQNRTTRC